MITVQHVGGLLRANGLSEREKTCLAEYDPLRRADIASIRRFVADNKHVLDCRVLDFGCGKEGTCRQPQPYRDLVGGEYCPWEPGDVFPNPPFGAILCTQVLQYVPDPRATLVLFAEWLQPNGMLLLTYGTNWPEVEDGDKWRFTKSGMEAIVQAAGFVIGIHEPRAALRIHPNEFITGYGLVAMVNK